MRREPSRMRSAWMMTSIEPTIISRMVFVGSWKPPMVIMDSRRDMASRGRVGVQRAHRAVMAGVHGLQQVERLGSAHFAHDDAFGAHTQAVPDQVAHGDHALAFQVGRAGFQPHHMRLLQLEFGGVLAGDDAFFGVDIGGHAIEQRGLARTGTAGNQDVAAAAADHLQHARAVGADRAELDQVLQLQLVLLELTDGEGGAVQAQRRAR